MGSGLGVDGSAGGLEEVEGGGESPHLFSFSFSGCERHVQTVPDFFGSFFSLQLATDFDATYSRNVSALFGWSSIRYFSLPHVSLSLLYPSILIPSLTCSLLVDRRTGIPWLENV